MIDSVNIHLVTDCSRCSDPRTQRDGIAWLVATHLAPPAVQGLGL